MRTLILVALASLIAIGTTPVDASHGHSQSAPYLGGAGATVDDGSAFPPTAGIVLCDAQDLDDELGTGLNPGCAGGWVFVAEGHEDDWANGYTHAEAVAQDGVFGSQVGLWVCLHSETATDSCNTFDDVTTRSCGLGFTEADTNNYVDQDGDSTDPGFLATFAVIFIDTVFVDPQTNEVCTATNGDLSITWS